MNRPNQLTTPRPSIRRILFAVALFAGAFLLQAPRAHAQEGFQIGANVGALSITDTNAQSAIGYGAFLSYNPYGRAAFRVDANFANFSPGSYFAFTPAAIFIVDPGQELRLGFSGGAGFYKYSNMPARFGLNVGALGEFGLSESASVGLELRNHWIFDAPDTWSVFITIAYHFGSGSGGDW